MAPRKSSEKEGKVATEGIRQSTRIRKPTRKVLEISATTSIMNTISSTNVNSHKSQNQASKKKAIANKIIKGTTKSKTSSAAATKATKATIKAVASKGSKTAKKAADTGKKAAVVNGTSKRKRSDTEEQEDGDEEELAKPTKKVRAAPKTATGVKKVTKSAPKSAAKPTEKSTAKSVTKTVQEVKEPEVKTRPAATKKEGKIINSAPTDKLNVFVFGENGSGELGIGYLNRPGKKVLDVKRPRLNDFLDAKKVGVVQISCGGMHAAALTHDNKILTWGVNDQSALGRNTKKVEGAKDTKENDERESSEDSDDEDDSGLNKLESLPLEVDYINIPEGTIFTKIATGDSITMVLTSTGLVYGCGTFRANDGILGFSKDVHEQHFLTLIPGLKNIIDIACGANHVLALDTSSHCFAFGSGQQDQLGRRIVERTKLNSLLPTPVHLPRKRKFTSVSTGAYNSFVIAEDGGVFAWGLNSFGQTGAPDEVGTDGGSVTVPTEIKFFEDRPQGKRVKTISSGTHLSVAVTQDGEVLVWGRVDNAQCGQDRENISKDNFFVEENGEVNKRLLQVPTAVPDIKGATWACVSNDSCLAVDAEGKAWSWGFSTNYQTGQGTMDDVEEATKIENSAVKEEKLLWCGLGGQFGMLASHSKDTAMVNGVKHN